jgi:hypothetical protein
MYNMYLRDRLEGLVMNDKCFRRSSSLQYPESLRQGAKMSEIGSVGDHEIIVRMLWEALFHGSITSFFEEPKGVCFAPT